MLAYPSSSHIMSWSLSWERILSSPLSTKTTSFRCYTTLIPLLPHLKYLLMRCHHELLAANSDESLRCNCIARRSNESITKTRQMHLDIP